MSWFPIMLNAGSGVRAQGMNRRGYKVFNLGSLGAVLRNSADQSLWALSANHVIGMNGVYRNTHIVTVNGEAISERVYSIKLGRHGNTADAAVAKLTIDVPNPNGSRPDLTRKQEVVDPDTLGDQLIGSKVSWMGTADNGKLQTSTLRLFKSTISLTINFGDIATASFDNQIIIDNSSGAARQGDSGSLVVLEDGRPLGILIAIENRSRTAVVSPLKTALDLFRAMPEVGDLVLA